MQSLHRVEKSHSTMVQEALGWEISRLRVSSKRFPSNTHTGASPPLEMTMLASAPLVISTEAKRSGEISRLNGQESGCGFRRGLCRRAVKGKVDGPPGRGLWQPVGGGLCSLRSGGDSACGAEGGGGGFAAGFIGRFRRLPPLTAANTGRRHLHESANASKDSSHRGYNR